MFFDDIQLVREVAERHGPLASPVVEVGGLEEPFIADYQRTIEAMRTARTEAEVIAAQRARIVRQRRPLDEIRPGYIIENPEAGGLPVERLAERYDHAIGTAVMLSTLEHVGDPFLAASRLSGAMAPGGLAIVSVPFQFPYHPSPEDNWRFTPSGLRRCFSVDQWEILECDWRLRIGAHEGVLELQTGRPQAIETCYIVARAV